MATLSGELKTWHKVTLDFESAATFSETPATFRDYRLDVTFTHAETGTTITVPGFFAADGDAGETGATSGNIWRANFNPPMDGTWTYEAEFLAGTDIAALATASASDPGVTAVPLTSATTGELPILPTDKEGDDFRAKGMILQDDGTHYLQHQGDGDYFVRGGPGVPENLLATADFDGWRRGFTSPEDAGPGSDNPNNVARHQFAAHEGDFVGSPDDLWAIDGENTGDGTNIFGAVDYLAAQGQNTIYLLTNTIGGDGRDVSPWADPNLYNVGTNKTSLEDAEADHNGVEVEDFSVYDVSKLDQWERLFDYMDERGIYKNVLFQETENDQLLNGGTPVEGSTLSVERMVYMREMIARFGHNNGIQWNLGEENTQTNAERADMAEWTKAVDPYDHLVTIHSYPGQIGQVYNPLVGVEAFDGPSFQTQAGNIRSRTIEFREKSAAANDPWVIGWDEDSGSNADVTSNNTDPDETRPLREGFWGHLTAGGSGANWYLKGNGFGGHSFDQNLDDFSQFEVIWEWTEAATSFFNTYIPFWEMEMDDSATSNTNDFVMSKPGDYYVIYAKYGAADEIRLDLRGETGETFDAFWYDPRNGGALIDAGQIDGGDWVTFAGPPNTAGKDWVLFVRNSALPDTPPSVPPSDAPEPPVDEPPVEEPPVGDLGIELRLIEPETDADAGALTNGGTVDLDDFGNGISVSALPDASVGSAVFTLDGQVVATENVAPYALFGDKNGDFDAGTIAPGGHELTVDFYSASGGSGTLLGSETVAFEVLAADGDGQPPVEEPPVGEGVFLGENGTVVIEAESATPVGQWSEVSFDGQTGLLWDAARSSYRNVPEGETLTYEFMPDEDGTYAFATHAARIYSTMNNGDRYESGSSGKQRTDTGNDAYFALIEVDNFYVLRATT
ncbi:MAG: DUF5060 domain-containing protein [Paracoccaceae bacterium]